MLKWGGYTSVSYLLSINHVDERLGDGHLPDRRHVETVHIIPPVDLLVLVLAVFDAADEQRASVDSAR